MIYFIGIIVIAIVVSVLISYFMSGSSSQVNHDIMMSQQERKDRDQSVR